MLDYEISPADAARLLRMDNENQQNGESRSPVRLLDVREPWEVATASIEGALLMPMGEVASRAHRELDPDDRLVVLCHHGQRSLAVTAWLREQGFAQAQSMRGGIEAWSSEVDPTVARY